MEAEPDGASRPADGLSLGRLDRRGFLRVLVAGAAGVAASGCGAAEPSGDAGAGPVDPVSIGGDLVARDAGPTGEVAASASTPTATSPRSEPTAPDPPGDDPAPTAAPGGPAPFIFRGPDRPARVALTFHTNGDLGGAERLLTAVESRSVPITAFVIGEWLDAHPNMARRIVDGGHELANHTYTHPSMTMLDRAAVAAEITRCRDSLARWSGGQGGRWFRPSGFDDGTVSPSAMVREEAGRAGYQAVIGFDVDPYDYRDPGADAVRTRTLEAVRAGSIISLHFGHPGTVEALPAIIDGLADRRLQPVTLSTLLG